MDLINQNSLDNKFVSPSHLPSNSLNQLFSKNLPQQESIQSAINTTDLSQLNQKYDCFCNTLPFENDKVLGSSQNQINRGEESTCIIPLQHQSHIPGQKDSNNGQTNHFTFRLDQQPQLQQNSPRCFVSSQESPFDRTQPAKEDIQSALDYGHLNITNQESFQVNDQSYQNTSQNNFQYSDLNNLQKEQEINYEQEECNSIDAMFATSYDKRKDIESLFNETQHQQIKFKQQAPLPQPHDDEQYSFLLQVDIYSDLINDNEDFEVLPIYQTSKIGELSNNHNEDIDHFNNTINQDKNYLHQCILDCKQTLSKENNDKEYNYMLCNLCQTQSSHKDTNNQNIDQYHTINQYTNNQLNQNHCQISCSTCYQQDIIVPSENKEKKSPEHKFGDSLYLNIDDVDYQNQESSFQVKILKFQEQQQPQQDDSNILNNNNSQHNLNQLLSHDDPQSKSLDHSQQDQKAPLPNTKPQKQKQSINKKRSLPSQEKEETKKNVDKNTGQYLQTKKQNKLTKKYHQQCWLVLKGEVNKVIDKEKKQNNDISSYPQLTEIVKSFKQYAYQQGAIKLIIEGKKSKFPGKILQSLYNNLNNESEFLKSYIETIKKRRKQSHHIYLGLDQPIHIEKAGRNFLKKINKQQ